MWSIWFGIFFMRVFLASSREEFYHLHIPKTGGATLQTFLLHRYKDKYIVSEEGTMSLINDTNKFTSGHVRVITTLRDPYSHVLSQYTHCTTAPIHKGKEFMPSLHDWLEYYSKLPDNNFSNPFHCYDPRSLQSSRLEDTPLSKLWYFGVLERMPASLCLLRLQMMTLEEMTPSLLNQVKRECSCSSYEANYLDKAKSHGVTHLQPHQVTTKEHDFIMEITRKDKALYLASLELLEIRLKRYEERLNFSIPRCIPA
jgi:hypothetical protein